MSFTLVVLSNNTCLDCGGKCCIGLFPLWDGKEIKLLSVKEWNKFRKSMKEHKCCYFKNGLCSIHERKPRLCREARIGDPFCIEAINR